MTAITASPWPSEVAQIAPPPTPFDTVADVKAELCRVYDRAKHRQVDIGDASRLANILMLITKTMETSELEARLLALEAA